MRAHATLPALVALLILPGLTATDLEAQTTLGIRGGASVASASVSVDETFMKSNRTGFAGGAFLDVGGSRGLGLQVALQYMPKGVDLDFGDTVAELSLDYFEVPAVVKFGVPLGVVKPSAFVGAALGFSTGCDDNGSECQDEFRSTDWSGVVGADVALYLGGVSLWVDGRYHVGLKDIAETDSFQDFKNRAWIFQAGLGLSLGG